MKKEVLIIILLMIFPTIFAINLEVRKVSSNPIMIYGTNSPATFKLEITNNGESDNFEFFNLLGFSMAPKGTISIANDQTKQVDVMIYPRENFDTRGSYTFTYSIKGQYSGTQNNQLTIRVLDLEDVFNVGVYELNENENKAVIYLKNKENTEFSKVKAEFSSIFFEKSEEFSLGAFEQKNFEITLDEKEFKKLIAGFYTINAKLTIDNQVTNIEGVMKLEEKTDIKITNKNSGIFIDTEIIKKENSGTTTENAQVIVNKNIISRLFTTLSPEPELTERANVKIKYVWERQLKPGEILEVTVKTNWLFPFIVIILLVTIGVLLKKYTKRNLIIKKRVNFMHSKGGELALRVSLLVKARKYMEDVQIIDRLPPMVKIFNQFGGQQPSRINEQSKRIEWNFNKLESGEVRVMSYVVYSKLGILGRFALPTATGTYQLDGNLKDSQSNPTFFIAEQKGREE